MPGQPAPAFRGVDVNGKPVSLADFRGKTVVLEWNNPNCPFVQKHYTSGNMQSLQQKNTAAGVVWLAINSTTESHSDYMAPVKLAAWFGEQKAAPTAVVMDPEGRDRPRLRREGDAAHVRHRRARERWSTRARSTTSAARIRLTSRPRRNHVAAALGEVAAGRPVTTSTTTAYGCTIKY